MWGGYECTPGVHKALVAGSRYFLVVSLCGGDLVSVALEDVSCVCSAMYPCVGLLVSCVFWPCPAMSLCACGVTGVLLCGHRPLVVCTILLSP